MSRTYTQDRDENGLTAREREVYRVALAPDRKCPHCDGTGHLHTAPTLQEIADEMGVNRSRAGQLVRSVIGKGFLKRTDDGRIVPGQETPK